MPDKMKHQDTFWENEWDDPTVLTVTKVRKFIDGLKTSQGSKTFFELPVVHPDMWKALQEAEDTYSITGEGIDTYDFTGVDLAYPDV